jgi:DNA modification methylase
MWIKQSIRQTCYGDGLTGDLFEGEAGSLSQALQIYTGQAAVVYLDPPYLSGNMYTYRVKVGQTGYLTGKPELTLPAYSDRFSSRESYLNMLEPVLVRARDILSDTGTLFVHLDYRMSAYVKVLLDRLMGEDHFVNEIIWVRETGGRATRHFSRKHDVILMYRKSKNAYFDISSVPIDRKSNRRNHMRRSTDENGRVFYSITSGGKTYTYYEDTPVYPSDIWSDVSHLQQKDPQRSGYDTQKPLKLLERIIRTASRPGDLVADLCFGSGTTLICAAREGRRFLGTDSSGHALTAAVKRLNGYGCRVMRETDLCDIALDADVSDGIGLYVFTLKAFHVPLPADIAPDGYIFRPLDGVDQWAAGVVKDGVFRADARSVRTKANPELYHVLETPMVSGDKAIEIIDVFSRKHLYVWQDPSLLGFF